MHVMTEAEFAAAVTELRGVQFPALSQGYVMLVDAMGGDRRVVDAARTTSNVGGKGDTEDVNLIRYLMRHRHSTPTEFGQIHLKVRLPMDAWRQGVRHRMASINEFSSRYSEVPDCNDVTPPDAWRLQSANNRQGSGGALDVWPEGWEHTVVEDVDGTKHKVRGNSPPCFMSCTLEDISTPGKLLSVQERELHNEARRVYEQRLALGVAKEQARKDLCLSTYTELYWSWDLHNLLHFLALRMDAHAQLEIRTYANIIGEQIVAKLFPVTWAAFLDYRFRALTLTALDIAVIQKLTAVCLRKGPWTVEDFDLCQHPDWKGLARCRERDECLTKLQRLGLVKS